MRILVTGAAGFIGSHLCEALIKDNQILGIDNFCDYYSPEVKKNNIEKLLLNDNFKIYEIDIRDVEALEEFFNKHVVDVVIHLAAMAGVRPSIIDPVLYTEVNINGTVNLLEQCKKHNVKKFIFASSSSVYGNNKKTPFTESDVVDFPISPYASTKKAGELICHTYHHLEAMSIVCLRFFTVYGPRQRPDLAIHKFAKKIQNNEIIDVYGDGSSKRDYTYITDILDGIIKAIEFIQTGSKFEVFNLGESHTISLFMMIETLEKALGMKATKNILPMQPGDVNITFADVSKSKKLLGYSPTVSFQKGIDNFVEWLD
jgi:UDP-glucuronate 4-epimerase